MPQATWHAARSILALRDEFNRTFPNRPKGSDGILGNASHLARPGGSDHNPDWNASGSRRGVVRAIDLSTTVVTAADKQAGHKSLTEAEQRAVIADLLATEYKNPVDRIHYIIHRFPGDAHTHIWSRTFKDADGGWTAKVYPLEKSMPHDHHFHVSIMHTAAAENDVKPWFSVKPDPPEPPSKPNTEFDLLDWNIGVNLPKAAQAKLILTSGATVVTLQECGPQESADLQDILGPKWMWTRSGTRTVFWNKTRWRDLVTREKPLPSKYSKAEKSIALVQLQHIHDKTYAWFGSTHFSADVYPGVTTAQIEAERLGQAQAFVKALGPYHWIVVGGDLNSSSRQPGKPRAVIGEAFKFLSDVPDVKNRDVQSHPTKPAAAAVAVEGLAPWIDDVMAKGGITVLSGALIVTKASDHNALLSHCRVNASNQKDI